MIEFLFFSAGVMGGMWLVLVALNTERKRLTRMASSAIAKAGEQQVKCEEAFQMYLNHLDSHECQYVGKDEQWPEELM
jgi:hypothetical protein